MSTITTGNYRAHSRPSHPRASKSGMVHEHILVAERALGYYLPPKSIVHHHDDNGLNNKNSNLVICEDQKYHKLLHVRMRVLRAGGDPNTDKICYQCGVVQNKDNFTSNRSTPDGLQPGCRVCLNKLRREYPQYK